MPCSGNRPATHEDSWLGWLCRVREATRRLGIAYLPRIFAARDPTILGRTYSKGLPGDLIIIIYSPYDTRSG